MSENEPNLGSEEANNRPETAGEVGQPQAAQPAPNPWAQPRPEPMTPAAVPPPAAAVPPAAQNPAYQNPADQNPGAQNPAAQNPDAQNPGAQNPAPQDPAEQGGQQPFARPTAADAQPPTGEQSGEQTSAGEQTTPAQPYAQPVGMGQTPYGYPPSYGQSPTWHLQTTPLGTPTAETGAAAPTKRSWRTATVAGVAAAAIALAAGGVGGVVGYALKDNGNGLQTTSAGSKNAAPVVDRSSLATIAAAIQPDVVSIQTSVGEGSGVVISADGYIVTNNHVVADATNSTVKVTFNSGKQVDAKVVGTDPKTDLAVVKVPNVSGLSFAQFGNSDDVQVGDTVLAIGSPLGLQGSVTAGIISALHRTITVGGEQQNRFSTPTASTTIGDAIQTDAPINPGNSGGALVDTNGHIVGINSAIATSGSTSSGNIGVGFAIPANKVSTVAQALIAGGKVSHPYLGVSVADAENGGALVQSVAANSPAAKAGLQAGDVVTKFNDRTVANSEDLVGAVQASSVGSVVTLTVVRNGSTQTVKATVAETP